MATNDLSVLSYALLGLIRLLEPCSGYDLRGFFASQPMATFSDSPGSIYPALKRLEQSGMVRSALDETSLVRRRKLYRLSSKGKKAFTRWLTLAIKADDAFGRMPELMLKFSFMDDCLGPGACALFLKSLAVSLEECITMLQERLKSTEARMSRSARLTLRSGIMGYECQAAWARMALEQFQNRSVS
jgi:DNA-binding PadR family transcriptional regulator